MHHPRADGAGGLRHRARAGSYDRVEGLGATLGQNTDEVNGDVGIAHGGLDGGRIAQIGLHGVDLADLAERLQMPGKLRPPHPDPDAVIALGQRPDHAPSQKARSPENRDQRVLIRCHRGQFLPVNSIDRARVFRRFAIRHRLGAVQGIWSSLCQFDKRATDPY